MRLTSLFMTSICAMFCLGCEPDFPKPERIVGYRVLGVIAEPPEIGPTDTVTLTLIEANDAEAEYEWSVCLLSLGSSFGFSCLSDGLELPLNITGSTATISLDEDGIDFFKTLITELSKLSETQDSEGEDPSDCGEACKGSNGSDQTFIDIQFRIKSGPQNGRQVETVKLVRVHFEEAERNRNPKFDRLELSERIVIGEDTETPTAFAKLTFSIDDSLTDDYSLSNGAMLTEEPVINWYSTEGTFYETAEKDAEEQPITFASQKEVYLKIPTPILTPPITIWGVLRDGRGGLDYRSIEVGPQE